MDEDMNPGDFESDEELEQITFNPDVVWEDFDSAYDSPKSLKIETLEEVVVKDRISALPDSLLVRILDFLPTIEELIRTGILSKRWQFVWTNVHTLMFIKTFFDRRRRPISDFFSFVCKTLAQRPISKLKRFKLDFDYMGLAWQVDEWNFSKKEKVSEWIRYALSCHVEELDLNLPPEFTDNIFVIPKEVFASPVLTNLGLRCCVLPPTGPIGWKMLRYLSIANVKVQEEMIQNILSGSPVLQLLKLGYCYGFERLNISSVSLKKLIINGYYDPYKKDYDVVLEVFAPNILSLDVVGVLSVRKFELVDVQSLVEAKIDIEEGGYCYISDDDYNMMKGFLQSLHHTIMLTLGRWCMQIISGLELIGWRSPLSKRKCLITTHYIKRSRFPALANLLRSSPCLEILVINNHLDSSKRCHDGTYTRENYLTWKKRAFQCLQLHLKIVVVACEWDREFELIQFLLQNSSVLEKMIIYLGTSMRSFSDSRVLQLTLKLLSCPRASTDAVVLFPHFSQKIF